MEFKARSLWGRVFPIELEFWSVSFYGGRKTGKTGKKPSEQEQEPTTNSTHIWRRVWESNPGHIGGRRALSPVRPAFIVYVSNGWRKHNNSDPNERPSEQPSMCRSSKALNKQTEQTKVENAESHSHDCLTRGLNWIVKFKAWLN